MTDQNWIDQNKGRMFEIYTVYRKPYHDEGKHEVVRSFLVEDDASDFVKARRLDLSRFYDWTYEKENLII